jgi:hypothetical protein
VIAAARQGAGEPACQRLRVALVGDLDGDARLGQRAQLRADVHADDARAREVVPPDAQRRALLHADLEQRDLAPAQRCEELLAGGEAAAHAARLVGAVQQAEPVERQRRRIGGRGGAYPAWSRHQRATSSCVPNHTPGLPFM